jgi:hypothetical protein
VIDLVRGRKDDVNSDGNDEWETMSPEKRIEMKTARAKETKEKPAETKPAEKEIPDGGKEEKNDRADP